MKISHSENLSHPRAGNAPGAAGSPLFACQALLWIGDTEHFDVAPAWRTCQRSCDGISIRRSIAETLAAPPRQSPSHIVMAQTNRHERSCWAIDGPDVADLREQFSNAKMLVLRGPLVAPTVLLPAKANSAQGSQAPVWVDSVSLSQAPTYLPHWFEASPMDHPLGVVGDSADRRSGPAAVLVDVESARRLLPVVVVAAQYALAESLIDSLSLLFAGERVDEPLIQWQRDLTRRSACGFGTVLWDDSVARAESTRQWHDRCRLAPRARHIWMTGIATPEQRRRAREQGVHQVLEKPGRLECLAESVQAA